jgi:HKD family nuclease
MHGDETGYLSISKGNEQSYKFVLVINKLTLQDEIKYLNICNEIVLSRMWYCVGFITGGSIDSLQVGLSKANDGGLKIRIQDSFIRNLFFIRPKVINLKSARSYRRQSKQVKRQ